MAPKKIEKKDARGGKREGAGRKPANPEGITTRVLICVPKTLVDDITSYAASQSISRSAAVTEAIRRLLHTP